MTPIREGNPEDNLFRDVLKGNECARVRLIEACASAYTDAEKTGYYEKFKYRVMTLHIMNYVWSD